MLTDQRLTKLNHIVTEQQWKKLIFGLAMPTYDYNVGTNTYRAKCDNKVRVSHIDLFYLHDFAYHSDAILLAVMYMNEGKISEK